MNPCQNEINFTGPHKDIVTLFYFTGNSECPLNFNQIIPLKNKDHWDFEWGTRYLDEESLKMREAFNDFLDEKADSISFYFDTRREPPIRIYEKIAEIIKSNNLDIEFNGNYLEDSNNVYGELDFTNGIFSDNDRSYLFEEILVCIEIVERSDEFEEYLQNNDYSFELSSDGLVFKLTDIDDSLDDFSEEIKGAIIDNFIEIEGKIFYGGPEDLIDLVYGDEVFQLKNNLPMELNNG